MTTTSSPTRGSRSRAKPSADAPRPTAPALPPTLGPVVCRFMEHYLVHGPGDVLGEPFRLTPTLRAIVHRVYELKPTGDRLWKHVLLGLAKGNVKSELAAAFAIAEAVGPVVFDGWKLHGKRVDQYVPDAKPIGTHRISPEIPIAAASFDQAANVFACAQEMIRQGPLASRFEVFDTEILIRDRSGKIERVAAVAGANDGGKPTFSVHDELHEWVDNKERVHLVLSNNLRKRANTWCLDISTAAATLEALLGRLYLRGKRIERKEEPITDFLMIWIEASKELNLDDLPQLEAAIRQANPGVTDGILSLEALVSRYYELKGDGKTHEFRRYHLNQFTSSPTEWLPDGAWAARADAARQVAGDEPVTLALDGDLDSRRVAVTGCTTSAPRHLFVAKLWEKTDADGPSWKPPALDTLKTVLRELCGRYTVTALGINPTRFPELFAALEAEAEPLPIVAWPTHVTARMAPASKQLRDSIVTNKDITHDGAPAFQSHVNTADVTTDSHDRQWVGRAPLAVAAVMANDLAFRTPAPKKSVYESRGVRRT